MRNKVQLVASIDTEADALIREITSRDAHTISWFVNNALWQALQTQTDAEEA